jgi:hypothetical protein
MTAIALSRSGMAAAARALIDQLESQTPRPHDVLAQWHAATGNRDQAFGLLRTPSSMAISGILRVDPLFDDLRADPRFAALK